jgi:hypothetical protein
MIAEYLSCPMTLALIHRRTGAGHGNATDFEEEAKRYISMLVSFFSFRSFAPYQWLVATSD